MAKNFPTDNDRAYALYCSLLEKSEEPLKGISVVMVQHILPNVLPFIDALQRYVDISVVIPKPKSVNPVTLKQISERSANAINVQDYSRDELSRRETIIQDIAPLVPADRKLIIIDIGGYFSGSLDFLVEALGDRFLGVVEDTENGYQKYQSVLSKNKTLPRAVFSVARSQLKEPEDHLVGQAVVYSTENVLRANGALLINKIALVLGYGKIGKSVAESLSRKNLTVWVYDINPIKRAQAASHGFATPSREKALPEADLIVGASGNKSLKRSDFERLKQGCFITSVTSADDEFDFGDLYTDPRPYKIKQGSTNLDIFISQEKTFSIVARGNAVNFLHGAVLGPYIYIVSAELISCMLSIMRTPPSESDKISTAPLTERKRLAEEWLSFFLDRGQ